MKKFIHDMDDFQELFEKLSYESANLGVSYTVMMFDITKKERIKKFGDFLLDNLRITDTVFHYHKTKFIIVLEETSIRRALLLNDSIRKKIKKCGCKFKFYSSAIQGDPMEDTESIIKALRKRLKKAKANKRTDFIHSLSRMN